MKDLMTAPMSSPWISVARNSADFPRQGQDGMAISKSRRSAKSRKAKAGTGKKVPGPSTNPFTNFLMADLILRAGSYVMRETVEKRMMQGRYGKETAREIVRKKSMKQRVLALGLTTLATRSVPGALIVGGGALAKTLYDRRKASHIAQNKGDQKLIEQAHSDD